LPCCNKQTNKQQRSKNERKEVSSNEQGRGAYTVTSPVHGHGTSFIDRVLLNPTLSLSVSQRSTLAAPHPILPRNAGCDPRVSALPFSAAFLLERGLLGQGYSSLCLLAAPRILPGPVSMIYGYHHAVPRASASLNCGFSCCLLPWRGGGEGSSVEYGMGTADSGSLITWARYLAVSPFTMLRCMFLRKTTLPSCLA
jgi:hypothetical protein